MQQTSTGGTVMTDTLETCRHYLADLYRQKLGYELVEGTQTPGPTRHVIWRTISAHDLTSSVVAKDGSAAGLLMDYEVGVLLYILPYRDGADIRSQITRALALRSRLLAETNYMGAKTDATDEYGDWRIVLHWLVEERLQNDWFRGVIELRKQTAFTEDIPLDVILVDEASLEQSLAQHGFPRLMLTIRQLLKKKQRSEIEQWLNVDDLVASALEALPETFTKPDQQETAREILREAASFKEKRTGLAQAEAPRVPRPLKSIHVQNLRNIDDVSLDFGEGRVESRIVHGPNGTGKSTIFEALSLALFQSSHRYSYFARKEEKDVPARDRAREYLESYLRPMKEASGVLGIDLNGDGMRTPALVGTEGEAKAADLEMNGTLLSQETSQEFLRMQASQLGAEVLKGYSLLAEHILDYADRNYAEANGTRQQFLSSLALSTAITRKDTVTKQIAQRTIKAQFPPISLPLVQWLERAAKYQQGMVYPLDQLAVEWRAWGADLDNPGVGPAAAVANLTESSEIAVVLARWLTQFNAMNARTQSALGGITGGLETWQEDIDRLCDQLRRWGDWLDAQAKQPASGSAPRPSPPEAEGLTRELAELQAKQKTIMAQGTDLKGRLEHLSRVEPFLEQEWVKKHPNECPTCGADHAAQGGAVLVIRALQEKTAAEHAKLRAEYTALTERIRQLQVQFAGHSKTECPVSTAEQAELSQRLKRLVSEDLPLQSFIAGRPQRESLIAGLQALRHVPSLPPDIQVEAEARRAAQEVVKQFVNADLIWEGPDNWKPVRDELRKRLTELVNQHLPSTLQQLWAEFYLNLTPARWLLPGRMRFDVKASRTDQRLTVMVEAGRNSLLPRYILNLSEIHILGLAWFFTRYVTHGRFLWSCMIMDDPAQELDQTSYRDLCRLWETLIRLHKVYSMPLKLVIMLHQESRALDAARATGGLLYVLGWALDQEHSLKRIALLGPGFHSPQPHLLFKSAVGE
jgi:energy-coupling factor transporter ATP-binding protein EcfA2